MKLRANGEALSAAATWAARISPAKPMVSAVGGVLLTASDSTLTFRATDFDLFGEVAVPAEVVTEGHALVSAHLLAAVLKAAMEARGPQDVDVALDGSRLTVKRGAAVSRLPVMDAGLFPAMPDLGTELGQVSATGLRTALASVLPAASTDVTLPNFCGVEIGLTDVITLAATDRYRVAEATLPWEPTAGGPERVLLAPGELLRAAVGTLNDGTATLYGSDSMICVAGADHRVTGRLIDGAFPKWRGLIPSAADLVTAVTVDVAMLRAAVKCATIVLGAYQPVCLAFTATGCRVSTGTGDKGDAENVVDLKAMDGPPVTVWVNPRYLLDALGCLPTPNAVLSFTVHHEKTFLVRPVDDGGVMVGGYQHLIVAMRVPKAVAA